MSKKRIAKHIYFIRHGKVDKKNRRYDFLSEEGEEFAKQLPEIFKTHNIKLDKLVSSLSLGYPKVASSCVMRWKVCHR